LSLLSLFYFYKSICYTSKNLNLYLKYVPLGSIIKGVFKPGPSGQWKQYTYLFLKKKIHSITMKIKKQEVTKFEFFNINLNYLGTTGKGTDNSPSPVPISANSATSPLNAPAAIIAMANCIVLISPSFVLIWHKTFVHIRYYSILFVAGKLYKISDTSRIELIIRCTQYFY